MRASYCESNSPETTSQRKAGKTGPGLTLGTIKGEKPTRLGYRSANKHLGICRAMRKMERNKGGGLGNYLQQILNLSSGCFGKLPVTLHLGENKIVV